MKVKILNYLKADRSFNNGVQLYVQFGNNSALKAVFNKQGFSDYNHRMLLEALRQIAGIPQHEFNSIIAKPVTLAAKMEVAEQQAVKNSAPAVPVTTEEKAAFIAEIPEQVRKTIRLRDEFPFLASPDCPQEFKILVHDMINAYSDYVEGHKRLFEATTGEELQAIAAGVVEDYIENHEIWDELNHFKTTGQILGKHPIFAQTDRMAKIKAMPLADQVKLQKNLMNNLARTKKNIADNPEHKNTGERKASVSKWEVELEVVNGILGLNA